MKKLLLGMIVLSFACTACVATVGPHGTSVAIAPPLPLIVELDTPYYTYQGYNYYYNNSQWYYSQGPASQWVELPRDRHPRETRPRGKGWGRGGRWHGEKGRWDRD